MTKEEQAQCLKLARAAIVAEFDEQAVGTIPPTLFLAQPTGVFVTLHTSGRVRGCIGWARPVHPLYRAVALSAAAAAFRDVRFPPLCRQELTAISIEISVLSALSPIAHAAIVVGKHGLFASDGNKWGVLLPQVAADNGWGAERFFAEVCKKAGIAPAACTRLEGFTAEVFSEEAPATGAKEAQ
jgi:hypothetical protein